MKYFYNFIKVFVGLHQKIGEKCGGCAEIIETDKDEKEINREKFTMDMDLLDSKFKLKFENFGPYHDKVKGKQFFLSLKK